ncbi:hypothetical protein [Acidovorax sp. Leaf78]|uniref:hypothetical protein n=1 Tax=Acidovorax sp. Leaf78 TaxID=1736237 RepID=UPI0012E0F8AD|nr:hypothetical protein [Acidovorax sp. Leaf78]
MSLMKSFVVFIFILIGCQESQINWLATERVDVYKNDDSFEVLFRILPGEMCGLSLHWEATKAAGYKKVICEAGEGWVIDDRSFKRAD